MQDFFFNRTMVCISFRTRKTRVSNCGIFVASRVMRLWKKLVPLYRTNRGITGGQPLPGDVRSFSLHCVADLPSLSRKLSTISLLSDIILDILLLIRPLFDEKLIYFQETKTMINHFEFW